MVTHRFVVPDEAATERLDRFLSDRLGQELSRARIQRLIADGHVLVDGGPAKASLRLSAAMTIMVNVPPPAPTELVAEPIPLEILHEDEDLIAIAKPAGMAVHPGAGHATGTLVHALLAHCDDLSGIGGVERPGIVHRLDKDTSGVIVVAKNDGSHAAIAEQFSERRAEKQYRAWVLGTPPASGERIESLIARHPSQRKKFSSRVSAGKQAITQYTVKRQSAGVSELEVEIFTGRTHQIRVHLADRGLPIVADALYNGDRWNRLAAGPVRDAARGLGRQALHAERLVLTHPRDGRRLELEAPLPADLRGFAAIVFA